VWQRLPGKCCRANVVWQRLIQMTYNFKINISYG
jgi:hypothetical protein